ncbi:MAG: cytidine deaminase [Chlamydiae bacterium]|nr:cytidine deaminase [Chlamydiota bacterium]
MLKQWAKELQTEKNIIDNPQNIELSPSTLTEVMKRELVLQAQRARTFAYAPYSKFHVGSAILTKSGHIYTGANYENAAYGSTLCAEGSAIAKTVSFENRGTSLQMQEEIIAVAVVLRGGPGSPCGNCRQSLFEFNPNMLVIMADVDGEILEKPLSELLPMGFGPCNLKKAEVK